MINKPDGKPPADKPRPVYVTSRLRYFDGEFLKTRDFVDEQNYHVDRQTRHEACLHAPGVLEGLDVTQASNTSVSVSFGSALDADGNQILLSDADGNSTGGPIEVNLPSDPDDGDYVVDIMFVETKSDPQPGSEGDTRFTQDPDTADGNGNTMLAIGKSLRPGAVPLARVRVTVGAIDAVDTDYFSSSGPTQKYAGVKLPGPSGNGATLRVENVSDDPNGYPGDSDFNLPDYKVSLSASGGLEVDGPMTVSDTLTAQSSLNVTGLLTANGGFGVGVSSTHIYEDGTMSIGHAQSDPHPLQVWDSSNNKLLAVTSGGINAKVELNAQVGLAVTGTATVSNKVSIGTASAPTSALEVYDGENELLSVSASGGLTISSTQIDNSGQVAIGKSAAPSNPLEVYDGENELLSVSASDGMRVTGEARVSDLLTASGGLTISGTQIDNSGQVAIGKSSAPSNPLEVCDGNGSTLLTVKGGEIDASVVLKANQGLQVGASSSLFGKWQVMSNSNSDYVAPSDGFVVALVQYSATPASSGSGSLEITVNGGYVNCAYAFYDAGVSGLSKTLCGSVTVPVQNGQTFTVDNDHDGAAPGFYVYWVPIGTNVGLPVAAAS